MLAILAIFGRRFYVLLGGTHDQDLLKNNRLPVGEIRRRHRQNATSFLGQFYGFVVKTILTFGMMFTLTVESGVLFFRMVIVVFFWVEFGIIAFVEVLTSQNLRQNLWESFLADKKSTMAGDP